MKGYRFYVRKFLNLPGHGSSAHVLIEIPDDPYRDATVDIADCSRKISLEFPLDPKERRNSLRKIDLLISTLQDFRKVLRREAERKRDRN